MTSPQTNPEHAQEGPPGQGGTPGTEAAEAGTARSEAAQATPTPTPTRQAPMERPAEAAPEQEEHPGGKVLHLHTAHPRVPIPYVTPGDMFTGARVGALAGARAAASRLPSPRKLTYYGLLGGMTVAGLLEWPVAVAIGAATEVITREQAAGKRAERAEREGEQRREAAATEPSARAPESARPARTATA